MTCKLSRSDALRKLKKCWPAKGCSGGSKALFVAQAQVTPDIATIVQYLSSRLRPNLIVDETPAVWDRRSK